jgi:CubicO group peptidase (beta-lactamase class C family)
MMKLKLIFCFLSLAFLHSNVVRAQTLSLDTLAMIDKIFSGWSESTPGGVVQLTREGQTIYLKAFGMADLEHNTKVTTETIFEAGSVSKQFTAAAVLLLIEQGKIKFTDNILIYFPDFPAYGKDITIDNLLHHTSGLRDWGSVAEIGGWPRGTRVYTPAHVKQIIWRQSTTNFKPGTAYSYSNSNYSMLTFLVEKVSGQSFQSFTSENLFKPLGMLNTGWRDNYRKIIPGRAVAYSRNLNIYVLNMPFENTFGHGGLLTTSEDLSKWNYRWKTASLGLKTNQLQKEKGILNNAVSIAYARGVSVNTSNGFEEISHSGSTAGYRSWLAYYPEKNLSVTYLSNDGSRSPVEAGKQIAEIFLGKEAEKKKEAPAFIPVQKSWAETKAGLYKEMNGFDIQELIWKDSAIRIANNQHALNAISTNSFFIENIRFDFPPVSGIPPYVSLTKPAGDTSTYIRVVPFKDDEKVLSTYLGTYYSEEADVTVKIILINGKLQISRDAGILVPLKPIYLNAFVSYNQDQILFKKNENNVIGFGWSISRAYDVWFKKIN